MWLFLAILLVLGVVGLVVGKAASSNPPSGEWECPHGYDDFSCQPCCPLYEHCWGEKKHMDD
ncbi:MAG: hypothetical protein E7141_03470 [Rikenellaceae bacterium]|nr:hypothetical protein [Rikenellaceae bacterium]